MMVKSCGAFAGVIEYAAELFDELGLDAYAALCRSSQTASSNPASSARARP